MKKIECHVDNENCEESLETKMIEYNALKTYIDDGYIVLINMQGQGLFFGYKKDGKWYR